LNIGLWWRLSDYDRPAVTGKVERYRAELKLSTDWDVYLRAHSRLPGPRANLELVEAVGDVADADTLWRLSASSDEFLALCGTAGLGRLAVSEPEPVLRWLEQLAADPRWRVREGVAIALQRLGRESMPTLLDEMEKWSRGGPYVQRAAAAALCEPALLKRPAEASRVLKILDHVTRSMAATRDRKQEGYKVLRKAMGYCWSVAAAANPEAGRRLMAKWLQSKDPDVRWVMQSNLGKARLSVLGKTWLSRWKARRAKKAARVTR
jgi:hypothetical protein